MKKQICFYKSYSNCIFVYAWVFLLILPNQIFGTGSNSPPSKNDIFSHVSIPIPPEKDHENIYSIFILPDDVLFRVYSSLYLMNKLDILLYHMYLSTLKVEGEYDIQSIERVITLFDFLVSEDTWKYNLISTQFDLLKDLPLAIKNKIPVLKEILNSKELIISLEQKKSLLEQLERLEYIYQAYIPFPIQYLSIEHLEDAEYLEYRIDDLNITSLKTLNINCTDSNRILHLLKNNKLCFLRLIANKVNLNLCDILQTEIKELRISCGELVGREYLGSLSACNHLLFLELDSTISHTSSEMIGLCFEFLPSRLKKIKVGGAKNVSQKGWEHLGSLEYLEAVELNAIHSSNGAKIETLPYKLKKIAINENHIPGLTDTIGKLDRLEELSIYPPIKLEDCSFLLKLPESLVSLKLCLSTGYIYEQHRLYSDYKHCLESLSRLKSLEEIDLSSSELIAWDFLIGIPRNIKKLYLNDANISIDGLVQLQNLEKLESLSLCFVQIDNWSVLGLLPKSIRFLDLVEVGMDAVGSEQLQYFTQLETLECYFGGNLRTGMRSPLPSSIKSISIYNQRIGYSDLAKFCDFTRLEQIVLECVNIVCDDDSLSLSDAWSFLEKHKHSIKSLIIEDVNFSQEPADLLPLLTNLECLVLNLNIDLEDYSFILKLNPLIYQITLPEHISDMMSHKLANKYVNIRHMHEFRDNRLDNVKKVRSLLFGEHFSE